ncbi:MAG TPA: hypothetical protein VES89_08805 [Candidatus Competibacteraceae bacterium]|nr:hypothetical protein [Candidatus Competibacteraceae bacterium]
MRKFLVLLYQPYKWFIYLPFLIVSTLIFSMLAIVLSRLLNPKVASRIGGVVWARLNSYLIPMRAKVTGKDHLEPNQSYVIVANHQS